MPARLAQAGSIRICQHWGTPAQTSSRPVRLGPWRPLRSAKLHLLERCGLVPDTHAYHLNRFLHEFFPRGTAFPALEVPEPDADLPLAPAEAFSLDDVGTTEIDDAVSLARVSDGDWRVGIHIAGPARGFGPGSPRGALARERLGTAFLPGAAFRWSEFGK